MWGQLRGPLARKLVELLDAQQYEQMAALIQEEQRTSEQVGNTLLATLLSMLLQISLVCNQCFSEELWHQHAYHLMIVREQNLRQHLRTILDLVSAGEAPPPVAIHTAEPPLAPSETPPSAQALPAPPEVPVSGLPPPPPSEPAPPPPPLPPTPPTTVPAPTAILPGIPPDLARRPTLIVYCLGAFRVYQDDQPIDDWLSRKAKALFKYLITYRERPIAKEVLMDIFWPDAAPDAARNNLNVAVYSLRQTLRRNRPDLSHILYQNDSYGFNPELHIWVDVETFTEHLRTAQQHERQGDMAAAIHAYRAALALYQGEFIEEDRYEEWLMPRRQQLHADYLASLDSLSRYYLDQQDYDTCIIMCSQMLTADPCQEEIHRRLMHCYDQQGLRYLALRQYHICVDALARELDAAPDHLTVELYERIRQRE